MFKSSNFMFHGQFTQVQDCDKNSKHLLTYCSSNPPSINPHLQTSHMLLAYCSTMGMSKLLYLWPLVPTSCPSLLMSSSLTPQISILLNVVYLSWWLSRPPPTITIHSPNFQNPQAMKYICTTLALWESFTFHFHHSLLFHLPFHHLPLHFHHPYTVNKPNTI